MIKLRQMQEKQKQTNQQQQEGPAAPAADGNSSGTGYVLKKQNSRELAQLRSSKKSNENIFARKRGRGNRGKSNAAQLRAQKGTFFET
jgi:hypothetical protein